MKKIAHLVLICMLLNLLFIPAKAAPQEISITTREQLEEIAKAPDASYRLDANIDMSGGDWLPIPFSGRFNGNGHAIYNLTIQETGEDTAETVDGNGKKYDTVFAGLFSVVRNAEIRDLKILGADVSIETAKHCFAAVLAGYMDNTSIINCTVEGHVSLYAAGIMAGVGGVAGFGYGRIEHCKANVQLLFADRSQHTPDHRCEQFMGGILATGCSDLIDNFINIRGIDSCWGYVHNGGVIGMHYKTASVPNGEISSNRVEGSITFFENNSDRRAYCNAIAGEMLPTANAMLDNSQKFKRDERYGQTQELEAHECDDPSDMTIYIPHTEEKWGRTVHQCGKCGYIYKIDYQAPGHIPGEWEIIREPDWGVDGIRRQKCTVCGDVITQETIPQKIPVSECTLSQNALNLHYKEDAVLTVTLTPENTDNPGVVWSSSDDTIASVDQQGRVTALKRGSAVITCSSQDGFATASCPVTVDYSLPQWLIEILLFGWIWY